MIRALVFDFDGLILDTEEPIYRSWRELYAEHGVELPFELWVQTVGSTNKAFQPQQHLEKRLGRPLPSEVIDRRMKRRTELVLAERLLPGVKELVEAGAAAGLALGVASSSNRDWVDGHLERLGLRAPFRCIRCRDDVVNAKPEPDLYLAVLECLDVGPSEAVAIEDSPNGVTAAKRAGLFCVAVPNRITAQLDLGRADMIVASLAEVTLAGLLRRAQESNGRT